MRSSEYILVFHKKNNIQSGDKYCKAMHFKEFDFRFHMLQIYILKSIRNFFLKDYLRTIEMEARSGCN